VIGTRSRRPTPAHQSSAPGAGAATSRPVADVARNWCLPSSPSGLRKLRERLPRRHRSSRRAPPLPESGLRNRRSPRWVRAGGRALPSASPTRTPPARAGSLGGPAASPRGSGDEVRYGEGAHAYRSEVLGARFVPRALGKVGPWWIPSSWRCRPCAMHVATL
jgi:hypothetical protein